MIETELEQVVLDLLGLNEDQLKELMDRLAAMRCGAYGDVRLVFKGGDLYKISTTIESKPYYKDKKTGC